jgi:hypothetical protein
MQDDTKLNNDNKQKLHFEFEELEARIAPSVVAGCVSCVPNLRPA